MSGVKLVWLLTAHRDHGVHPQGTPGRNHCRERRSYRAEDSYQWRHQVSASPLGCLLAPQEAVIHTAPVNVVSRDRPRRADAVGDSTLTATCARVRSIERGDSAVLGAQVAV